MMTTADTARAYIQAVSDHDLDRLETLLDERVVAAFAGTQCGKREWIGALNRLLPVLVRNDIREIYTDDTDRACVIYDFVTDTDGGIIRCVELVTVRDGRITEIDLILDRLAFAPVNQAIDERAAQAV